MMDEYPPTPDQAFKAAVVAWAEAYPDKPLRWFAERWRVAPSTVLRTFRRYGYMQKIDRRWVHQMTADE